MVNSLLVARMDVTDEVPPTRLNLQLESLPALVMFPANDKEPPFHLFSGVAKVLEMMKWVHQESSISFHLPPLAHLNDEDVSRFKEQVAEREEALAKGRSGGEL